MATILSPFTRGVANVAYASEAGCIAVNDFYADVTAADLALNNIIDLGILPAGHTITDAIFMPGDLDTGTTLTLDIGIVSGTPGNTTDVRTVGTELFAGSTAAQTGAIARLNTLSALTIVATPADRSIGVKIATAAAGATAGRIRLRVLSHAVNSGFVY